MCENNSECSLRQICVRGECLDSSHLHVALSNTIIVVLPIVMSFIFIGIFVGCMVGCIYMARKRQQNLMRETHNQATMQAHAERQAMQSLQNQPYQHPDIPSQYNHQLQSYVASPENQAQIAAQSYQPVPAAGGIPVHQMETSQQQYQMAQQQLYSGMPQAQEYQMNMGGTQGQGPIVQPVAVVGDPISKKDPDL